MNSRKQNRDKQKLPLPSPRSPVALDEKILAYSKERALESANGQEQPPKSGRTPPWLRHPWASGLATASVVAIAVLVTEPKQNVPALQGTPSAPVMAQPELHEGATRARMKATAKREVRLPQQLGIIAERQDYSALRAADTATAPAAPVAEISASATTGEQPQAGQNEAGQLDPASRRQLAHCAELLHKGQDEQARSAYQQLRQQCPDCPLPDTVEQAIERYLKDY